MNSEKTVVLVLKRIVAARPLREHVRLLCWFTIEWRIQGKPALSHAWLSLAYNLTDHHMADFVQSAQRYRGWRDRRLRVDDYV
jgi:hypothetical protein